MPEEYIQVTGEWFDAIGTIISAYAEMRALAGLDDMNNELATIGEGLQAVGSLIVGTVESESALDFAGNWIDGVGAATSSLGAYLKTSGEENNEIGTFLETFGNTFQSMGSSMSALSDYLEDEPVYFKGNVLQGLGAGLEAIGGVYDLNGKDVQGQPLKTVGAILQAIGANLNAIYSSQDLIRKQEFSEEKGVRPPINWKNE